MKCPVPGCTNQSLRSDQLFCPICGLLTCYIDSVEKNMRMQQSLIDMPEETLKLWSTKYKTPEIRDFCELYLEFISGSYTHGDICSAFGYDPNLLEENYRNTIADPTTVFTNPVSSTRSYRLHNPQIVFFRCWFCDIHGEEDFGPLLPPATFAHSTMNDDLMEGLRPDYNIYNELKRKRDAYARIEIPKPQRTYGNVNRIANQMARLGNVGNEYMAQMADWQRAAQQADDVENSKLEHEYYRAQEELRHLIVDMDRQMAMHQMRPDARAHQPCRNCNAMFPFVLRNKDSDILMRRSQNDFNRAKIATEFNLYEAPFTHEQNDKLTEKQRLEEDLIFYQSLGLGPGIVYLCQCEMHVGPLDLNGFVSRIF